MPSAPPPTRWKALWPMICGRCPPIRRCSTSSDQTSSSVGVVHATCGTGKPQPPHSAIPPRTATPAGRPAELAGAAEFSVAVVEVMRAVAEHASGVRLAAEQLGGETAADHIAEIAGAPSDHSGD